MAQLTYNGNLVKDLTGDDLELAQRDDIGEGIDGRKLTQGHYYSIVYIPGNPVNNPDVQLNIEYYTRQVDGVLYIGVHNLSDGNRYHVFENFNGGTYKYFAYLYDDLQENIHMELPIMFTVYPDGQFTRPQTPPARSFKKKKSLTRLKKDLRILQSSSRRS